MIQTLPYVFIQHDRKCLRRHLIRFDKQLHYLLLMSYCSSDELNDKTLWNSLFLSELKYQVIYLYKNKYALRRLLSIEKIVNSIIHFILIALHLLASICFLCLSMYARNGIRRPARKKVSHYVQMGKMKRHLIQSKVSGV